jgi:hypothetical protein
MAILTEKTIKIAPPVYLSQLLVDADKDWAGKNITNFGSGGVNLYSLLTAHASRHAEGGADTVFPWNHASRHASGGADAITSPLNIAAVPSPVLVDYGMVYGVTTPSAHTQPIDADMTNYVSYTVPANTTTYTEFWRVDLGAFRYLAFLRLHARVYSWGYTTGVKVQTSTDGSTWGDLAIAEGAPLGADIWMDTVIWNKQGRYIRVLFCNGHPNASTSASIYNIQAIGRG